MTTFNIFVDGQKVKTVNTAYEAITFVVESDSDLPITVQKIEELVLDFNTLKLVSQ